MSMKEAYKRKMKAQLDEWSAKLDVLKAKASKASAEGEAAFSRQIESINQKRDEAKKKLQQLSDSTEVEWEQLRGEVDSAWDKLKDAVENLGRKLR